MPPKIEFAFLAEYALSTNNRLSAMMSLDRLVLPEIPGVASFYVAGILLLEVGAIYSVSTTLLVKTAGESSPKQLIKTIPGRINIRDIRTESGISRRALAVPFHNILFEQPGEYMVEIVVDDLCVHTLALEIEQK